MAVASPAITSTPRTETADREITITREFDAPRELVYRLWTDAEHVSNWWGPRGFTTTTRQMDVRPEGIWIFTMHSPDGTDYANRIVYREVVEPERLVYDHFAGDEVAPHFHAVITFDEAGDKTRITLHSIFPTDEQFSIALAHGAVAGANQTLERFGEQLSQSTAKRPTLHELFITRIFDAPRELVYEAFTNPEHAMQWMGPRGFTATHFEQDARPGGKWRACLHQTGEWNNQSYPDLWQGGVFKKIEPPERLVYTFAWEGQGCQPTRETLINIHFTEFDSERTRMDFHQAFFDSVEQRDGHNVGWNSSFDRLNDYVTANVPQLRGVQER
jgi:uncharacterized protein YndB with AHSA1/START domain